MARTENAYDPPERSPAPTGGAADHLPGIRVIEDGRVEMDRAEERLREPEAKVASYGSALVALSARWSIS